MAQKTKDCPSNEVEEIRVQLNALQADVAGIAAKLDADAAITLTNYASDMTSEAVTLK